MEAPSQQEIDEMSLDELKRARSMAPLDSEAYDRLSDAVTARDPDVARRREILESRRDEMESARAEIERIEDERPKNASMEEYRAWERRVIDAKRELSAIHAEILSQARDEDVGLDRGQDETSMPDSYI